MAAQGGPVIDLRDDKSVRSVLFHMLVDWSGSDLKNVYEPLSDQVGYFLTAGLFIVGFIFLYYLYRKWNRKRREKTIPYKVIKPPKYLTEKDENKETKRVVAIFGATGFVGSHIAETLIAAGTYRVHLMGRRFSANKILPGTDAVFQVDMMDYTGLVSALQGVDTVINSAVAVPTVFTTDDDVWRLNVIGAENILSASKEAGVKNYIQISGGDLNDVPSRGTLRVLVNALTTVQQYALQKEGLRSCVLCFGQIYGIRSSFWDILLSGKMTSFPKTSQFATFTPVEFVANTVHKVEIKLAQKDDRVVGKIFKIGGHPSTFKEFTDLEEWGTKISDSPVWLLKVLARLNYVIAKITGWAPIGSDMSPAMMSFFEIIEKEVDNTTAEESLGIGKIPSIKEGVSRMVARFNENKKKKNE